MERIRLLANDNNVHNINQSNQPYNAQIPHHMICPIGLEIMNDPIICSDGYSYERINIQNITISPITRQQITSKVENRNLKTAIDEWKQVHHVQKK